MAISTKTTVTRELSSKTQTGLSELISRAFSTDEAFGFDKDGLKLVNDSGGTHQQSTIAVNWTESVNEVKQVFTVNPGNAFDTVGFSGEAGVKKVQRTSISVTGDQTVDFGNNAKFISFTLGGRTITQVLTPTSVTLEDITSAMVLALENQSEVDGILEVSNTVLDITYTLAAGDISIGTEVEVKYNNGNFGRRYILTNTTSTASKATSKSATVTMLVEDNIGLPGAKAMEFTNYSSVVNIAAGSSLAWWQIANQEIGILGSSSSFESRTGLVDGNYQIALKSGYANSTLSVKTTVSRPGETDVVYKDLGKFRFVGDAASENPDSTEYVANVTETNGIILIRVQDPTDNQFHTASVDIPADTAITEVEAFIQNAINTTVIGTDSLGKDIYMSTIVKATVGAVTSTAGVSSFTITVDWASVGVVTDNGLVIDTTGLIAPATTPTTVAGVTAGVGTTTISPIAWKHVSTSSTLQPGGETNHFATLIFTAS